MIGRNIRHKRENGRKTTLLCLLKNLSPLSRLNFDALAIFE
jgi:hypothetical protein